MAVYDGTLDKLSGFLSGGHYLQVHENPLLSDQEEKNARLPQKVYLVRGYCARICTYCAKIMWNLDVHTKWTLF